MIHKADRLRLRQTWRELPTFGFTNDEAGQTRASKAAIDVSDATMMDDTRKGSVCWSLVAGCWLLLVASCWLGGHNEGGFQQCHTNPVPKESAERFRFQTACGARMLC